MTGSAFSERASPVILPSLSTFGISCAMYKGTANLWSRGAPAKRRRRKRVERPSKILVVDDTARNIRLMEAMLTPRGYEVASATRGAEALAMVQAQPPD